MIDHMGITVPDFDRSKAFYDAVFAPLGATLLMVVPPEYTNGVKVGGYGRDHPSYWLYEGTPPANDCQHIAFTAEDRAAVDAFSAAAIAAGGRDKGPPGLRLHYHPNDYGVFVFDPDGNTIEAVCHLPLGEGA
ncbi:VOC family protein [Ensifer soli]|uniref:VOC family protein n=1 Tax=Ciceribacter sp. sgz301302 TaxID=3342379 RepID=UPI0035BA0C77